MVKKSKHPKHQKNRLTKTSKIKILNEDKRRFPSGANRQDEAGKGLPTLCSPVVERILSKHMQGGVEAGYDPRNWEKGIPLCDILNSLKRHIQDELEGKTDENHAASLLWNAHIYNHTKEMIRRGILPAELDNRPNYIPISCPNHLDYLPEKPPEMECDICKMIYDNKEKDHWRKENEN
jgi:hypothetical protein